MVRKKKKTPSWIDVKRNVKDFNKDQLLDLIGDLYRLSANNKEFFNVRFSLSKDPLESYKRIIQDAIHPYLEDNKTLDIGCAEDIHGILMRVASLENTLHGKIKAWGDRERRQSKKFKDLGDIARLVESHPPLWDLIDADLKEIIQKQ